MRKLLLTHVGIGQLDPVQRIAGTKGLSCICSKVLPCCQLTVAHLRTEMPEHLLYRNFRQSGVAIPPRLKVDVLREAHHDCGKSNVLQVGTRDRGHECAACRQAHLLALVHSKHLKHIQAQET